jgi:uncharacterized protein (TIGR03083 family)
VESDDHLRVLEREGDRFAATIEHGPLDAAVPSCPGWTLADLATHVGAVHRWAAAAVRTGARPTSPAPTPSSPLAEWYRDGLADLLDALRATPDDAPTWHPFPAPLYVAVWKRRQAHEVTVHRWDAQRAAGSTPEPIEPETASDGIDEFFGLIVPRVLVREGVETPRSSVHVHCTDVAGEWLVTTDDSGYRLRREHAKGDAAVRGPAAALLLYLYGRVDATDEIEIIGDADAADAWRSLPGF